jgi:DNA-binding NarL/FixJ family response regulator
MPSKRLVMLCQPPPFDRAELRDEEFVFVVCDIHSQLLCCQLLPCDVIVMTVEYANSDDAKSCASLRFGQRPPPALVVMADDRTAVPEYLHPQAVIPKGVTARELVKALRNLPRCNPEASWGSRFGND